MLKIFALVLFFFSATCSAVSLTLSSGAGLPIGALDTADVFTTQGIAPSWNIISAGNVRLADPAKMAAVPSFATLIPANATFQPMTVVQVFSDFAPISGAGWISTTAGGGMGFPGNIPSCYVKRTFTLPSGFTLPSLTMNIAADNGVKAYLNGHEIGEGLGFQSLYPVSTSIASFFQEGTNTLSFDLINPQFEGSMIYGATVNYTPSVPEPGSASMAVAALGLLRRRNQSAKSN